MNVLIIEDEIAASENLTYQLHKIDSAITVVSVLDSVKAAVAYFKQPHAVDLVLLDIHLADGISFEIFDQVEISVPIIFTTAYNQYTLKAFKLNSIDYLLKPIDANELYNSLQQFKEQKTSPNQENEQISGLLQLIKSQQKTYKTTFLIHQKDELVPVQTAEFAYFYIDTGVVKGTTHAQQTFVIDKKLEELENELNPELFCRVNRQFIVSKKAIAKIKYYFGSKLIVSLLPAYPDRIVISKAKATEFKKWIDS